MKNKILMVYPLLGMSGAFVKHAPIGLLYASAEVVKQGFDVEVFDARLHPKDWREQLRARLDDHVLAVGISVMTGTPVLSAQEIGALVKEVNADVHVVWGGPFATFHPEYILRDDPNCDFVISGYGSKPFSALVSRLYEGGDIGEIPGVSSRKDGEVHCNPADWTCHEFIHHKDIPYGLIKDFSVYGQLDQEKRIFSIYSAMGCAYNCAFCSSPALYDKISGKRWVPLNIAEVVDHVEYAVTEQGADYIYFIDDDSFVNLGHVEAIIDEIMRRGVKAQLGFRGARINEIMKMDHAFIDKLVAAGTDIMHVGAESGSDRILDLVRKNCTVSDILECNKKLAQHEEMLVFYNFIIGLPTETVDELKATGRLMLQLVEENPNAIIGTPNKFRALPGTELFELAKKEWGYEPPKALNEYADIEVEGDFTSPWFSKEFAQQCDMMLVTSYFVDNKVEKVTSGRTLFYRLLRLVSKIYAPVAKLRLRHGFAGFLVEKYFFRLASKILAGRQEAGRGGEG